MARPLRIEYEGAFYHVYSRGERKENIFFSNHDRIKFLDKLTEAIDKFNLLIHCYALMSNHYHMLIETPDGNLSKSMHQINTSYANWFKSKYKIIGSVFHSRYKAILVEKDSYLITLGAYIHLNPVRAGLVSVPEQYNWTSFNSYININKEVPWIYTTDTLNLFGQNREDYKNFVYGRMSGPNQINQDEIRPKYSILGTKEFLEKMIPKLKLDNLERDKREKPDLKKLSKITPSQIRESILGIFQIEEKVLFNNKRKNDFQKLYLYGLKKYTKLNQKEIGNMFGIDYSAVSQKIKRFIIESEKNKRQKLMIEKFDEEIKNIRNK
jgi:REP element-mobilizing transposase RayT